MKVYHVGGSLFKLTPVRQFSLQSSDDVVCTITAQYWQAAKTDSMRNWYVAAEGMKSKNIKSTVNEALSFVGPITRPEQYRRYPEDAWSPYTPQERFGINARMTVSGVKIKPIIPSPVEMTLQNNQVAIDSSWVVLRSSTYTKEIQLLAGEVGYYNDMFDLYLKYSQCCRTKHATFNKYLEKSGKITGFPPFLIELFHLLFCRFIWHRYTKQQAILKLHRNHHGGRHQCFEQ